MPIVTLKDVNEGLSGSGPRGSQSGLGQSGRPPSPAAQREELIERIHRLDLTKEAVCSGEPLVYWEAQGEDRMCALHCLNSLMQGPVFWADELSAVALQMDETERSLLSAESLRTSNNPDVVGLLLGNSTNVADDGFFSFSVLEKCLKSRGVACSVYSTPHSNEGARSVEREQAFLCNRQQHWFVLRRLLKQDAWYLKRENRQCALDINAKRLGFATPKAYEYDLDSLKPAPIKLQKGELSGILQRLREQRYSVFVVRQGTAHGEQDRQCSLPSPNPFCAEGEGNDSMALPTNGGAGRVRRLNKNQFYLTDRQIEVLRAYDNAYLSRQLREEQAFFGDTKLGMNGKKERTTQQWFTGTARRLDGSQLNDGVQEGDNTARATRADEDLASDPELQEALKRSLEDYYETLPIPPEEPPVSATVSRTDIPSAESDIVIMVQVRFPDGTCRARKFWGSNCVQAIFWWLERERLPQLSTGFTPYALLSQFPRRVFCRWDRSTVLLEDKLQQGFGTSFGIVSDTQGIQEISKEPIRQFFPSGSQQLMFQLRQTRKEE